MNIQTMLQEIASSGMSDYEIAALLSIEGDVITQPSVNRWRNGVTKKTDYDRYLRIRNLHCSVLNAA